MKLAGTVLLLEPAENGQQCPLSEQIKEAGFRLCRADSVDSALDSLRTREDIVVILFCAPDTHRRPMSVPDSIANNSLQIPVLAILSESADVNPFENCFETLQKPIPVTFLRGALKRAADYYEVLQRALLAEQTARRFGAIYHGSGDAIMLLTEEGFFDCNPRTLKMFEFNEVREFIQTHPVDLSPEFQADGRPSGEAARGYIEIAFREGSAEFEWTHQRRNGENFDVKVLLTAFNYEGKTVLQATVRDISEQKRIQKELCDARDHLEKRVEERTLELARVNATLQSQVAERIHAETELQDINRMLNLINLCNQEIARATDITALLRASCELLQKQGAYPRVWALHAPNGPEDYFRVVHADPAQYNNQIAPNSPDLNPIAEVLHSGAPLIIEHNDTGDNEVFWKKEAIDHNCTSSIFLPLANSSEALGVLGISVGPSHSFRQAELRLLVELAGDLGNALSTLRDRAIRRQAFFRTEKLGTLKAKLLSATGLDNKLRLITDALIDVFHADFARIWMIRKADQCELGCVHAKISEGPNICVDRQNCLHLMTSSGRYTHLDGAHGRVPLGAFKIGRLASGTEPKLVSNHLLDDPHVSNHAWAADLGLQSFAGYKLLSPEGKSVGVMALFAKHAITPEEDRLLEDLANTVSHVILSEKAAAALRENERFLQAVIQSNPVAQFVIDKNHHVISWNRAIVTYSGITAEQVLGTNQHWKAFYPEERPCLVDLLVEENEKLIPEFYARQYALSPIVKGAYEATGFFPIMGENGRWLHFTAAAIRNTKGVIIGGIETLEDITEQKIAEEELRKSRDELELRVAQRTRELAQTNAFLIEENETRKIVQEALRKAHDEAERLLASMSSLLIGVGPDLRITRWNNEAESVLGLSANEAIGREISDPEIPWNWKAIVQHIPNWPNVANPIHLAETRYRKTDGSEAFLGITINPVKNNGGESLGFLLLARDVTERRNLELQLAQAQKLESIGSLAAGIAHEINTPIQYVGDNLEFLRDACISIRSLLQKFGELMPLIKNNGLFQKQITEIEALAEDLGIDFLTAQIPRAVEQSLDGTARVAKIVQAMKEFSHPGSDQKTPIDLNDAIESTITVAKNEWKYVADLTTELDPSLPSVTCLPGEFNQVILNMVVNAAHAIADAVKQTPEQKGHIIVSTQNKGEWAEIRIQDSGSGIPENIRNRIFDPFFTTKEVGKGTGQGLAIAHNVIVEKHGGQISVESQVGLGTTFTIRLPIHGAPE